jgi:hypothetical protein
VIRHFAGGYGGGGLNDIVARTAKLNRDFYVAMRSEDDLGLIVRGHIFVEHQVREYIAVAAPKPDLFKFSDFDYFSTVRIAFILGLDAEFHRSLPALCGRCGLHSSITS